MATEEQLKVLLSFRDAAKAAGHIWPEYAACEAVLESNWGTSRLAREALNLFGQKQHSKAPAIFGTLALTTQEFIGNQWVDVVAQWVVFPSLHACFEHRMTLLRDLSHFYPAYAAALAAPNGEDFVMDVSRKWSTDPNRGAKVLEIYRAHSDVLSAAG